MNEHAWKQLNNLFIVACHAVYVAENFDDPFADSSWYLLDYQDGEPPLYLEHIRQGVEIAHEDSDSLLIFSGGQTRFEAGPRSEAQSYWAIAEHFGWWEHRDVRLRSTTEEYARDSFENLLFGICRFRECVGKCPDRITVLSWGFKADRFDFHRGAIRFPEERFTFLGVNDPPNVEKAIQRDMKSAVEPFMKDPYGCGEFLSAKRRERNPFKRQHGYAFSCPELEELLRHQGPELYQVRLPWD